MIDRFGKRILVGWSEHETLWVQAAMTLPFAERNAAYRDIASMTGRLFKDVHGKAYRLSRTEEDNRKRAERRRKLNAARIDPPSPAKRRMTMPSPPPLLQSEIRRFTPQELMTGRVR